MLDIYEMVCPLAWYTSKDLAKKLKCTNTRILQLYKDGDLRRQLMFVGKLRNLYIYQVII